ncbi:MAG: fimbrillin family protein [Alistipes sp.]|nr:fimbrillin family protein [Alistipes sp.]
MNLKNKICYLLLTLTMSLGVSCNDASVEREEMLPSESTGLRLRVADQASGRTVMGEDGGASQEIRWAVGDKVAVWAQSTSATDFTLDATPFTFATYNAEYSSADFLADAPAMAEDTYRYYALYPLPGSRNDTEVSYTLPTAQSGAYDPALDVMTATTTGNALLPRSGNQHVIPWDEPTLSFSHLFHLVRIRIPEGKNNLELPIKRLIITFPQAVVGTVTFDVKDPANTATWSNLSNQITVDLADNQLFDAGKGYVWLHVKPGALQGELSFQAYNEAGVVSETISTYVDKSLDPQRITPIALTIPQSPFAPFTYIDIRQTGNNLGEDWQTMTISGYQFLVPFSETTVSSLQFTPNASNSYKIAVCANPATMGGASIPIRYESEHTLFDDPVTLPATVATTGYNTVNKVVPYLLEEDFTGAPASQSNDTFKVEARSNTDVTGVALGGSLTGWNASRYQVFANQYARIGVRYECGAYIVGRYCGRLDTPPLTKLKTGANAVIKVTFDMGCYVPNKGYLKTGIFSSGTWDDSDNKMSYCMTGSHTNASNPIKGQNQNDVADQFTLAHTFERMCDETGDTGSFTENAFPHKGMSFVVSAADNTTRVCWWALTDRSDSVLGKNCHYYFYIDNIKISIDNSVE